MVLMAGNPMQACIKVLRKTFDGKQDSINTSFRVSDRGFDEHEDDLFVCSSDIIKLMMIANEEEKS